MTQGTPDYRFEAHYYSQLIPTRYKVYNQLDELTYDLQQGFVDENDNSDEECFLDARKNTEFYTEAGADWIIFRGVKLRTI